MTTVVSIIVITTQVQLSSAPLPHFTYIVLAVSGRLGGKGEPRHVTALAPRLLPPLRGCLASLMEPPPPQCSDILFHEDTTRRATRGGRNERLIDGIDVSDVIAVQVLHAYRHKVHLHVKQTRKQLCSLP